MSERKPNGYWTKERCAEEALKYKTRTDFRKKSNVVYKISKNNNWLNDICKHITIGNRFFRLIYKIQFTDNYIYIGLTGDYEKRIYQHLNVEKSSVYKHIQKTKLIPTYEKLTDYIEINKAVELEKYYVEKYKNEKYLILNVNKTGGIGGDYIKWTYDECEKLSKLYHTKKEFKNDYYNVYCVIMRRKWYKLIKHMTTKNKQAGYWDKIKCKEVALKCKNKKRFEINYGGAYSAAKRNGWLDEICSHMNINKKIHWTKEKCYNEAIKYKTKIEFIKLSNKSYCAAIRNGWLDEICSHMKQKYKK